MYEGRMRRIVLAAAALPAVAILVPAFLSGGSAVAQQATTLTGANENINAPEIIRKFAAKEKEFAEARNNYTYRQSLKFDETDPSGNPTGARWEQVSDIIFTPEGKRMEKVIYAPVQSLRNIILTP